MDSTFRSLRGMLGLTIAAAALLLAVPAVAAADTLTVNDDDAPGDVGPGGTCGPRDHPTINDALSVVADGDTIRVCAGTYDEFAHFANSNVTLLGAQAGVDPRTRAAPETQESVVSADSADGIFASAGEDVIVDGFTITNNPSGPGIAPGFGTAIRNNVFSNNSVDVIGSFQSELTIRHNRLTGSSEFAPGVILDGADGSVIDENLFDGNHGFASILIGFDGPGGENVDITGNEILNDGGIGVAQSADVTIDRNVLTGTGAGELGGIAIFGSFAVDVTRNVIDDPGSEIGAITLFNFAAPSSGVNIARNTLLGDGDEAGVWAMEDSYGGALDVHYNRIAGNQLGLLYEAAGTTADATNNWWGCNEGPEIEDCDPVVGSAADVVDFDPWLVLSADADPTSIAAGGDSSEIAADLLTNSDGEGVVPDFPDGTQIDFATDLGTVDPLFDLTQGAVAGTTLTSGEEVGTANVESTLDNETVSTAVEFTEESAPPDCTERIDGTPQNDRLNGTEGSELIRGRGGRDKVNGLGGDDCVKGGSGPDKVVGGPGEDRARGGAGDDKVRTRDGEVDVVRCGAGDDRAVTDTIDNVKGCEKSDRFA